MSHRLTDEETGCLAYCATYEQYRTMRQRFESGKCGFCNIDPAVNTIQYENDHWIAWENAFRNNRPCKVMLVILTKAHLRHLRDVPPEAWSSFHEMMQLISEKYDLEGGMLFIRFGDMRLNAGTVPHLHWNLWVPDQTAELRIPIYKDPSEHETDIERAKGFAERYERESA